MRTKETLKADNHAKRGFAPSRELLEELGRFIDEVAGAGVLYATDQIQSAKSARAQLSELF